MTREEAIKMLRHCGAEDYCDDGIHGTCKGCNRRIALDMAIEALKREQPDEWCADCKEYDTEKKCCPRFNKVIREAMKRIPHDDGTLEVKVEDATKVGRVLISDDKHRGGLYYPDEDEPQSVSFENDTEIKSCSKDSDLISRADAIEALGEEPPVWCDEEYEIAERDQWRADIEAIKFAPSADRPRGEWVDENGTYYANCSKCGYQMDTHEERGYHNFCPNCGADMRGDTK